MPPGTLTRFRELVRRIKAAPAYTEAIGEALATIGPDSIDEDPATLTPEISLRSCRGQVEVLWNKDGQEGVVIQKDSGNGQWTFLALDTRPDYIDNTPMPATSAKWKYRAIYSNDAQRIGRWSNVAEIGVGDNFHARIRLVSIVFPWNQPNSVFCNKTNKTN